MIDDLDKQQEDDCMNQYCRNEQTQVWPAKFSNQTLFFCQECLNLYNEKKCCYFCAQVYSDDNQNFLDGQKWIGCDQDGCEKWFRLIYNVNQKMVFPKLTPWWKILNINIFDQKQRFSKAPCRIMNKKALKYLEKMNRRQNNPNEQTQHNIQANVQQFYYCPSASSKQSYLEELLKKNGGFCQQATQEEIQVDLQKMMSLMKQ
ncbi:unnamed protein product (macronuclear) [Paramecium tetraurelia]|uniref:Uncharacterized protein n=1 Tax=Paramecium tetraurelia TaxID=5888 RepID=A0CXZ3_PARTE|nr:uncharacterized protein GSPATT00011292001 [Paramecium tetraurelia]CAK75660.1 unnamed protein product [Paramecium tetraurelia]|eukprot:XP_001443057.1 hypothetical protein (macronuclear) [Paramecium tetraurelia strain d4-2]